MKTIPSENRTETGCWNNFDSVILNRFVTKHQPKFVDVIGGDYWKNNGDTVVIKMPNKVTWNVVMDINALDADEFDVLPNGKNSVVIRLWWD